MTERLPIDDPLQFLRALRSANKAFAPDVLAVVRKSRATDDSISRVSPQDIAAEVIGARADDGQYQPGLLAVEHCDDALRILQESGLLDRILFVPGMEDFAPFTMDQHSPHHRFNVFEHTLLLINKLREHPHTLAMPPDRQSLFLFAALLHDIGKRDPKATQMKEDGTRSYYGHEDSSADIVLKLASKWNLPADNAAYVHEVVRHHMDPHSKGWGERDVTLLRFQRAHPISWQDIIIHAHMDSEASGNPRPDNARYSEFIERTHAAKQRADEKAALHVPALDGNLILQRFPELTPGPWMKWILTELGKMHTQDPDMTEAEDLAAVEQLKPRVLQMDEFQKHKRKT